MQSLPRMSYWQAHMTLLSVHHGTTLPRYTVAGMSLVTPTQSCPISPSNDTLMLRLSTSGMLSLPYRVAASAMTASGLTDTWVSPDSVEYRSSDTQNISYIIWTEYSCENRRGATLKVPSMKRVVDCDRSFKGKVVQNIGNIVTAVRHLNICHDSIQSYQCMGFS